MLWLKSRANLTHVEDLESESESAEALGSEEKDLFTCKEG